MKKVLFFLALFSFSHFAHAQSLEENSSVLLMKANILFESGRYDEAVRMYNRILSNDPTVSTALVMRGKAKYELGAYKGTKNDVMKFIESEGVTKDVIILMAKTEHKLDRLRAATNYINSAIEMDPYDADLHLLAGEIARDNNNKGLACEMYDMAAAMGSAKAKYRISEECNGVRRTNSKFRPVEEEPTQAPKEETAEAQDNKPHVDPLEKNPKTDSSTADSGKTEETPKNDDGVVSLEDIVEEAKKAESESNTNTGSTSTNNNSRVDRDAVQSVEVDSKLYIDITNGLGTRKLTYKPNIFMLSDQDGVVVIDVCIAADGSVDQATFNREKSTIFRSSLTSLALRKAKSFEFQRASTPEQCGTLIFNIKS